MATGAQPMGEGPSAPLPPPDLVNSHLINVPYDFQLLDHDVSPKPMPEITTTQRRVELFDHVISKLSRAHTSTTAQDLKDDLVKTCRNQIMECKDGAEDEDRTILHWIAHKIKFDNIQESDPKFTAAGLLAEIATSMDPKMLSMQDTEKKSTPIHLLISHAKSPQAGVGKIILDMCHAAEESSPKGKTYASNAISTQNKDDENCLHMAIKKDLSITKDLIELASADAVVAVRSIDGNTPLHDAVDANLCAYSEQDCKKSSLCSECQNLQASMTAKKSRILQNIASLITKNPNALRKKNTKDLSPYLLHKHPRTPVRPAVPTTKSGVAMDKDGPIQGFGGMEKRKCKTVPSDKLDKEIEMYLVESAFDLGGFGAACDCFFGDKTDLQELHSVFRPERPLSGLDSDNTYPFFKCGTTLAQVDLSIDPMERKGGVVSNDTVQVEDARTALSKIFEMLRKKNVKRILKLTVRDNTTMPCSDEFIENCLRHFDIRYLDWDKPDLCADVVIRSAPRVAELWLYATGNNAVLRGWAGNNGLSNLLQLRSVHVRSKAGLESYPNHLTAIKAFKRDLRANVEVVRKLRIITNRKGHHQTNMENYKSHSDKVGHYLRQVQAQLKQLNLSDSHKKNLADHEQIWQQNLKRINDAITAGDAIEKKLATGVATLLEKKEANLQSIIGRLGQQQPQDLDEALTDKIDVSELKNWGIESLDGLAFSTDFVALQFRVESNVVQPATRSGTRLKMKTPNKYDESPFKPHRWVESLRKFVSAHVQGSDGVARVKVALIDDGVDVHLGDLKGKVKAGWPTEKPTSSRAPFYQSTEGHGTAMARLITTACSHVDLYVAKLESLSRVISRDEPGKLIDNSNSKEWTSTADEAASAVKWAREQKVDIISMSWSLIATKQNKVQLERLSQEIQLASKDHIILYCAAADQGMYGSMKSLYPANASADMRVVGSATETGHSSGFVYPELVDYLFPGEEFEEIGNRKGSSAATALAAGFAALIIWCHGEHFRTNPDKRAWIRNPERMHYLFQGLQSLVAKSDSPQNKWVDASMVLDEGGIKQVIRFVEREVERRDKSR